MTLQDYFRQPATGAATRSQPHETGWMFLASFELRGPRFLVVDAAFLPSEEDGLTIEARPGKYIVEAKVCEYGEDRRISRLRAINEGCQTSDSSAGMKLGETWTDTARTALCDLQVFSKSWGDDDEASYSKIEPGLDVLEPFGVAVLDQGTGAVAPFVDSGFGDGTYPVFALVANGRRVGFEIEFIAENTPYPFGESTESRSPKIVLPEQSGNIFSDLLKQLGEALTSGKGSSSKLPADEKKKRMEGVFQHFEKKLVDQAEAAAAEYRDHLHKLRSKAPPPTMTFHRIDSGDSTKDPEVQRRVSELTSLGFCAAGMFATDGLTGGKLVAFLNPDLRIYASLNFTTEGLMTEFWVDYPDDTTIAATDSTKYSWILQPPWRTVVRKDTESLRDLLDFFVQQLPGQERPTVSEDELERNLTPGANRHLSWRNDIGGLTKEEFRTILEKKNPGKPVDEELLTQMRLDAAEKALFNWLRSQDNLPFKAEEAMASLIIVHDEMDQGRLANAYWCGTGDFKARETIFEGKGRDAFGRVNKKRGERLTVIASKHTGLAADFYVPRDFPLLPKTSA